MSGEPLWRTVAIVNERGLHARAAAGFVRLADQFDAEAAEALAASAALVERRFDED